MQDALNLTPQRQGFIDMVVAPDQEGVLRVSNMRPAGGTDFFEGSFTLQVPRDIVVDGVTVGTEVQPLTLDGLNLTEIQSAMTVGPMVHHFLNNDDHLVNYDSSLGTFPPFDPSARYARSAMYEGQDGRVHMVVFDAAPYSDFMKGVTPREAARIIPQDARWAVFVDGGQSSRLTFRRSLGGEIDSRGNRQYVRLHKLYKTSRTPTPGNYLWSGRGREVPSTIEVYLPAPKKD